MAEEDNGGLHLRIGIVSDDPVMFNFSPYIYIYIYCIKLIIDISFRGFCQLPNSCVAIKSVLWSGEHNRQNFSTHQSIATEIKFHIPACTCVVSQVIIYW